MTDIECPTRSRVFETARGARQHHTKVHGKPLDNRTCGGCGDNFYDPKARLEHCDDCDPNAGQNNGNWSGASEETECDRCGTAFEYYPSDKNGVYCSECVELAEEFLGTPYAETVDAERVSRQCDHPEEEFEILQSSVERGHGRFCSHDCRSDWMSENWTGDDHHRWKGGKTSYLGNWSRARERALERDDYQCQRCGKGENRIGRSPVVHHITPVREFDDPREAHDLDNLVTLYRGCHAEVEHRKVPVPRVGERE